MFSSTLNTTYKQYIYAYIMYTHTHAMHMYVYELSSVDERWNGKGVQDPKDYATARHKHSQYFFLLQIIIR